MSLRCVVFEISGGGGPNRPPPRTELALKKPDRNRVNQQLYHGDWSSVFLSDGPAQKWHAFCHLFTRQLDGVAPIRRVSVRPAATPPVSAATQELLRRRRAALTSGSRDEYREVNRLCKAATRADSRTFYQEQISRGGAHSLWRVLRPVIGRKQQHADPLAMTPDALNEYYVTIGPVTAAGVPTPATPVPVRLPRVTSGSFKVHPIDIDALYATLLCMKPSTATGPDGVSVKMLQMFFPGLSDVLLDVVNASLRTGLVPAQWKHAMITPIPKGKTANNPADTRPISILPGIMKVVEKVVQAQLTEYLDSHHLLAAAQHGYRKLHSTETALNVITDRVLDAMDNGEISILVLLDLSKCFDVVPHQKLIEKLKLYGVDTVWFDSYLRGHVQQVQIRRADGTSIVSRPRENSIGVFQGGSLSCVLYMLFANDLSLHVPDGVTIVQFADDTQILVTGKKRDLATIVSLTETALDIIYRWFCQHGMKTNASKTKMLVLGTPAMLRSLPPVTISFCETVLRDTGTVKNLGLHLDRHLSYQPHIDAMTAKCTGILIALSHARHVMPARTLKVVVQALVLSIVRYCMSVYGSCGVTRMARVQKIINFCARVVCGRRRRDHISGAIEELGWLRATEMVEYHTICAVQRAITTGVPQSIGETIGPVARDVHDHDTRNADRITRPRARTETGRRRLCIRGVEMLNSISSSLDPNTSSFRRNVKRVILSRRH